MNGYLEVTVVQLAKLYELRDKEDFDGFNRLAKSYGAELHDRLKVVRKQCFIHDDKIATGSAQVPCAPGGKLWLCDECQKPENSKAVFEAYQKSHGKTIKAFKQVNTNS